MEPKIYLLVYDIGKNQNVDSILNRYILDSKDFVGYWNYIPFVYILKSYESIQILRAKFQYIFPGGGFLIAEISATGVDGLLPREAWEWFWHSHGQLSLADALRQLSQEKEGSLAG